MTDQSRVDELRAAREELDAVIQEIRAVPGYEDFLAPPTFDDVVEVAHPWPIVYLVTASLGGLALLVSAGDVTHIRLDGLSAAAVRTRVTRHFEVYRQYRADPETVRPRWFAALDEVTAWLWDEAMAPVMAEIAAEVEGLVVVAGGLVGLLPLHAAWTADPTTVTGRRHVLDDVPITYAPNARSVQAARRVAAEAPVPRRLLAVVEPKPVAAGPLPFANDECLVAAAASPSLVSMMLSGGEATSLSFERNAATADVLHLACHGIAELQNPLESGLLLADGRLTLRRLLGLELRARLTVLSACETAQLGLEVPDEVVALPTGLLQAGVAGVVASQWSVPDRATAMLMTEFYRSWVKERRTPADALRAAQRWLRDTTNQAKIDHLEAAMTGPAAWLPAPVGERFIDGLAYLEPEDRDFAELHQWAAFAHVGA